MEYEKVKYDLANSGEIKLLTKQNAPLILSFLHRQFKQKPKIAVSESELENKLEDYLEFLRETEPEAYPRLPKEYLTQWCEDRFLRKTYTSNSDDPVFELTSVTEKVISWLEDLKGNDFIGTESQFMQIFNLLKEIRDKSTEDVEARIAQLEQDRDRIQQEIDRIKQTGKVENYNRTQIQERFDLANQYARGLIGDFREVEQKFRELTDKITSAGIEAKVKKGSILATVLDADAALKESNQGKSFYTFFRFLQSDSKQKELEELIEAVYSLEDLSLPDPKYESLRGIKSRLTKEAQHIVQSNYRLAAKIRQMLDESNLQENKRVGELIVEIQGLALQIRDHPPLENLLLLEREPELNLFMDRPLHSLQESPSPSLSIDSDLLEIDLEPDLSQIYNQVSVDETLLRDRIEQILITAEEITLVELIGLYPITKGLMEIVAYIAIAKEPHHYINETKLEYIDINSVELESKLSLTMPQVVFRRSP